MTPLFFDCRYHRASAGWNGFKIASLALVVLMIGCSVTANAAAIAQEGIAIFGVSTGVSPDPGTEYVHAGVATNVNDENLGSSVDTFNNPGPVGDSSYVGVVFPELRTDQIVSLTLDIAAFFDGGWFGPNGTGPGATGTLNSSHLSEPTLQISTDGGSTWLNTPHTSNYLTALPGTILPVAFGPPTRATATFFPSALLTGINGIRLIGSEGGTASGGFLGVFELAIEGAPVPEPSAVLMLVAGALVVAQRRRR